MCYEKTPQLSLAHCLISYGGGKISYKCPAIHTFVSKFLSFWMALLFLLVFSSEMSSEPKKYFGFIITFDEFGEYFELPGV